MSRTFIFHTDYGEVLDIAMELENQGENVLFYIKSADYKKVGDGLIEKIEDWHKYMGQGHIFVFDGCEHGDLQDWLRSQGEFVFGGSEIGDKLENDRQMGQDMFKEAGFRQPESHNFTDIDEALKFIIENDDRRWILKQNGSAPKSINHMGKFDSGLDMILHLEHLKKTWNETEYGQFDCDLMEIIEGTEIAASAFWNGNDWLRNKEGKVVGFINFEEKKECDGGLGATTGEMGTTFVGVDSDNDIFSAILLNPVIEKTLQEAEFRGVFDINGTITPDGEFVGFEPTCRFGVPASSYELIEGLESNLGDLIEAVAKGQSTVVDIVYGIGMVMVVAAKPFPIEAHLEDDQTSMGEILWYLNNGEESATSSKDQKKHIHLYNFYVDEDTGYQKVATDCGYLFTVTDTGDSIEETRNNLIEYIKENLYISGMKWRSDIGKRVEDFVEENLT